MVILTGERPHLILLFKDVGSALWKKPEQPRAFHSQREKEQKRQRTGGKVFGNQLPAKGSPSRQVGNYDRELRGEEKHAEHEEIGIVTEQWTDLHKLHVGKCG